LNQQVYFLVGIFGEIIRKLSYMHEDEFMLLYSKQQFLNSEWHTKRTHTPMPLTGYHVDDLHSPSVYVNQHN
jgi:hypothetical protein